MDNELQPIAKEFYSNSKLVETWSFYKDYLRENYVKMDNEESEFEKLYVISEHCPDTGVRILNAIMANGFTCI